MISRETEAKIVRFFMSIAEAERTVEVSRQVLSHNFDFDACQIFRVLDTEGKNGVSAVNIFNFLKSKGVYVELEEAQLVVLLYDQDFNGILDYPEFNNMVQSEKNAAKANGFSQDKELSFNVEYSLTKLLEKEIALARNIISSLI